MEKRRFKEITPGMAIHCKTEEEAKELLEYLHEEGYTWNDNTSLKSNMYWKTYKKETCYLINEKNFITFGSRECYKSYLKFAADLVEYTDLILPELTATELLQIIKEICHGNTCGDMCPLKDKHMCLLTETDFDKDDVIKICTQWKADHEKKAPELEWVDICRIIKKYPDGRKECVHEEELTYEPGFQASAVEEVLGRYIKEHNGECFAVVEAVCRVKKSNGN